MAGIYLFRAGNDAGVLEGMPKMEGKRMLAIWAPKPQKKKEKGASAS